MYQSLQGNLGLGKAIEYFTSHNITVALPLNDTQSYDLIADFNGGLQRISVKTSRNQNSPTSLTNAFFGFVKMSQRASSSS